MVNEGRIDSPPPFRILFEDQHLLVLSKSAGLLSQGDISGEASLVDLLRVHFGRPYVGLIHRLDRNTSGLMIVAKRTKSAERLSAQLLSGELVRNYHAVLSGKFAVGKPETWQHYLLKNERTNEVKVVTHSASGAKLAVLIAEGLKNFSHPRSGEPLTLARFSLETGRSHQIRVQAAAKGHALAGDSKYGSSKVASLFCRTALHSSTLTFNHPMSKERMEFQEDFALDLLETFPVLGEKR